MPEELDDPDIPVRDASHNGGETIQIAPLESIYIAETVNVDPAAEMAETQVDNATEESDARSNIVDESGSGIQTLIETLAIAESGSHEPVDDKDPDSTESDRTLLPHNSLRSALVYVLFGFVSVWLVLNVYQAVRIQTEIVDWKSEQVEGRLAISSVSAAVSDQLRVRDEITALDGESVTRNGRLGQLLERLKPDQAYRLRIKPSDGYAEREIELVAPPSSLVVSLNKYFINLVVPVAIFLTGLLVFFFNPDNKLVFLMAITFALLTIAMPVKPLVMPELPVPLNVIWSIGTVSAFIFAPFMFHLHLLFPNPSEFVRRYPAIERLLYLPCFLLTVPAAIMWHLSLNGISQFDFSIDRPLFTQLVFVPHTSYLLSALIILVLNYLLADSMGKRRVRFLAGGAFVSVGPYLVDKILRSLEFTFHFRIFEDNGTRFFLSLAPTVLLPIAFAYAIVRHKVIPISLVIRRGVQYLLTKNALRLLLVLPVLGILWNAVANPQRRLDELLLQNSPGFYFCIVVAAALILLNRFGLRDWIDKKFFRQQYDQETILRDLTEAIKESDSVSTLSRLVSDKILDALHPSSVYLFFRDDVQESEFSLCYTTTGIQSADLKLPVDSPILSFMEAERRSIGFDDALTGELPRSEKSWLRSLGANLLVPMHGTDGKLAGFFTLGEKLSEIPYTGRDRELLESLANQIALMHENLTLKDRVRQEQKIRAEVLSRVDASSLNLLKECPKCGRCFDREDSVCSDDGSKLTFTLPVERTIENRYRLERLIGKGGMGAVYEAVDKRINRTTAVKILSGAMFGNREALRRFEREAQTAGRIHHHNIVTIFDYGVLTTEGAFLVMELVRGESLRDVLKRKNTLESEIVASWFGQILDGLEAAHRAGIIHRDLKPDNVLVTRTESGAVRLCILDFGLARHQDLSENVTNPGTIMGTLGYMSPEQLSGEQADERSDLFSVAVMIHEATYGEKPFLGKSFLELMKAMSKGYYAATDGPLAEFLKRGLAFEAGFRFESAGEMKRELTEISKNE
jgi:hypothetical protein